MVEQTSFNFFRIKWFGILVLVVLLSYNRPVAQANTAQDQPAIDQHVDKHAVEARFGTGEQLGTLWQDPGDIKSRNLFYGIGGEQHAPPPNGYTFVEEDTSDSSPKFVVRDSNGIRWKVKLGKEARGEIAATRLVWAAGYFTDEDYFLPELQVKDLRLKRGKDLISKDGVVTNARLERDVEDQKKIGSWLWKTERMADRRDFNGLKIMMALINNWDLKDSNTAIYRRQQPGGEVEYIYAVSDLGAAFGNTHLDRGANKSDVEAYEASEFIANIGDTNVRLATPGAPTRWLVFNPKDYFYRRGLMSVTREIPRTDARWMGELLSGLSGSQIRDAFRAGGFSPEETDRFARVVERRIEVLRGI